MKCVLLDPDLVIHAIMNTIKVSDDGVANLFKVLDRLMVFSTPTLY